MVKQTDPTNNSDSTNLPDSEKLLDSKKLSGNKKVLEKVSKSKKNSDPESTSSSASLLSGNKYVHEREKKDKKVKVLEEAGKEEGINFKAVVKSEESKEVFDVPLRLAVNSTDKNIDITKTSVWTLLTLNNMTIEEVKEFEAKYKDKLTFSEKLAVKLLKDALRGNKDATRVYWEVNTKVAQKVKVFSQVNFIGVGDGNGSKEGSIMSQMLDQITANLTGNKDTNEDVAQEGEIIE